MNLPCNHLDLVVPHDLDGGLNVSPSSWVGCSECLATGGRWLRLRLCLSCGFVGCCDSSPNKHASAHAHASGHPIVSSFEPDEDWCWCYPDDTFFGIGGVWLPHRRLTPAELHAIDTSEGPNVAILEDLLRDAEERHRVYETLAPAHHWSSWYAAYVSSRLEGKEPDAAATDAGLYTEYVAPDRVQPTRSPGAEPGPSLAR